MSKKQRPASKILKELVTNHTAESLSFSEIKLALQERGFAILMIFFSLLLIVPIPLPPGVAAIFGTPLMIFSIQIIAGMRAPWIPKWVGKRHIKRKTIALLVNKSLPYLKKMERLLKPRLFFATSKKGEKLIGIFSFIFCCSIMISIPFTHLVPALGIFLMAFGILSSDGIAVIIGMITGMFGMGITALVLFLGKEASTGAIHFMHL